MSDPTSPEAEAELGPPERLHPLFLLGGLLPSLRSAAGAYAFIGYLIVSGQLGLALLVFAGILAIGIGGVFLYWRSFRFRVGASEIRIDSGVLSRTHRSIPFDRVQDVDITQGPLDRIFGLAKVKFDTGGSAGRGAQEEGVLAAVRLERAEELRTLVRSKRGGAAASAAAEEPAEDEPVYAMDVRRLLLAGLFNFSLALFAGLFGATQTFGDVAGFDPLDASFWRNMLVAGSPIADYVRTHRVAAAAAGVVLLVLLGVVTGLVRTVLRDYGFRLDRSRSGFRRRRGLLTRTDVTIPIRRVQAAVVASGPVRDAFGWSELRFQSLARDEGEGGGDHVVAPLARSDEVDAILTQLGWEGPGAGVEWHRISRAYVSIFLVGISPLLLLLLLLQSAVLLGTALSVHPGLRTPLLREFSPILAASAIGLLFLVIACVSRWLAWRRTAWALDGDRLLVRTGWWRRRLLILPARRIQSADYSDGLVSRRFKVATLRFGVAGSGGFSGHFIPALPSETARALRDQLLSLSA